jgi:hypothetical protein
MAVIRLQDGESGQIRPGDAVFHYDPREPKFKLHVGIYNGETGQIGTSSGSVWVRGIPERYHGELLGDSYWGLPNNYQPDFVGQRFDVGPANVKQVALIASAVIKEHNKLNSKCEWKPQKLLDRATPILDGIPLFVAGTCGQFVEYLYENAGLDLIDEAVTYDPNPKERNRINPATQLCVFWEGAYNLRTNWDTRYERYPDCLSRTRSNV